MSDLRVIIVGGGPIGFPTAENLDDQGHDVVVIERNEERCRRISDAYIATVIQGDGARPDILAQADPENADVVAGLTPTPGTNLAVCVLADRMHPGIRTVMRVSSTDGVAGYAEVVDETVFPERAGAHVAAAAIAGGDVRSMQAPPGELEIVELLVDEDAPAAGRRLADVSLPRGSLVISGADGDEIASSETELVAGERYLVAVEPAVAEEVRHLLCG